MQSQLKKYIKIDTNFMIFCFNHFLFESNTWLPVAGLIAYVFRSWNSSLEKRSNIALEYLSNVIFQKKTNHLEHSSEQASEVLNLGSCHATIVLCWLVQRPFQKVCIFLNAIHEGKTPAQCTLVQMKVILFKNSEKVQKGISNDEINIWL